MTTRPRPAAAITDVLRTNGAVAFAVEAGLLFGGLKLVEAFAFSPGAFAASQPSPYWIAVILLAVQRGILGGVLAALIASVLVASAGLPERAIDQSVAAYRAGILAQPLTWLLAGTLIGALRSRQAALARTTQAELLAARAQIETLAEGVEALLERNRALERRIAADTASLAASIAHWSLSDDLSPRDVLERAAPFLAAAAQAEALGVYVCEHGQYQHVSGAGASYRVDAERINADPADLEDGAKWALPLIARDGETPAGAVIVHALMGGVDPVFSRECLIRATRALQRHLRPAIGSPGTDRPGARVSTDPADRPLERALG